MPSVPDSEQAAVSSVSAVTPRRLSLVSRRGVLIWSGGGCLRRRILRPAGTSSLAGRFFSPNAQGAILRHLGSKVSGQEKTLCAHSCPSGATGFEVGGRKRLCEHSSGAKITGTARNSKPLGYRPLRRVRPAMASCRWQSAGTARKRVRKYRGCEVFGGVLSQRLISTSWMDASAGITVQFCTVSIATADQHLGVEHRPKPLGIV